MTPAPINIDDVSGGSWVHGEGVAKLRSLVAAHTTLVTNFNALLVKLDADAGVTDTDYESTLEVT